MKVACFVPLRKQSKRVLDKNNQLIGGKSLVSHITHSISACSGINSFSLYTSTPEYLKDAHQNFQIVERHPSLDSDQTLGIEIYQSFSQAVPADIYVLVHATSPFLTSKSLQLGLDAVLKGTHDSSFSVSQVKTFAWFDGKPLNYSPQLIPRTQDITPVFFETSAFYIYRREVLDTGTRIGTNPKMIVLSGIEAIDIDEPDDLELARSLFRSRFL